MSKYSNIHKGTIVWYWNPKKREWKKGKVVSVNRYWLTIKERGTGKIVGDGGARAYPATEPKPHLEPEAYIQWMRVVDRWNFYGRYMDESKRKLFKKLGIVPKGKY